MLAAMDRVRLRRVVVLALFGTAITAGVMLRLNLAVDHDVVALITPGAESPAAGVIRHDFPTYALHQGVGHDGQAFYVIAREPMHLRDAARWTDRPRYRLQRILLPVLAWSTHPQGGGHGLVVSLWTWAAVGVLCDELSSIVLTLGLLHQGAALRGVLTAYAMAFTLALFLLYDGTKEKRRLSQKLIRNRAELVLLRAKSSAMPEDPHPPLNAA